MPLLCEDRRLFRCRERRNAFTLIEVVLVVAIVLIVAAMTVPLFMRSYHAANLRTAARAVVTSCKYARNMAVLQQRQMTVFFNSHNGQIEIVALEGRGARMDAFLDGRAGGGGDGSFSTAVQRRRNLPEQVRIVDFAAPSQLQQLDGVYWVNYFPSGVSDSFSMRIADEHRRYSVLIEVDHLSGITTTTYE